MEEPSEECEIVCDFREPGLVLSSQTENQVREIEDSNTVIHTETLVGEIEDATVDVYDSGVCDVFPTENGNTVYQVSDEKQVKADAASVEDTVASITGDKVQSSVDREAEDSCDPKQNVQTETSQQSSVDGEMLSVTEKIVYQEMDNNKMDVDSKHANEECETNSDSAKVTEESTQFSQGKTDEGNSGTVSEVSSATEICNGEEITNVDQKEENGEAMEVDYAAEEQVEEDVKVGSGLDNAADKPFGSGVVSTQHVPLTEADGNDSSVVKEMETDERRNNVDLATDLSQTIDTADLANPNSPSEDAATGEVEPLDHNTLFDPSSDITNFIDFSGVSCWSGNIQDLKTETGNVSLQEDKTEVAKVDSKQTLESFDATVNAESHDNQSLNAEGIQNESRETCVSFGAESPAAFTDCPREVSDAIMGSEEDQEDKDHEGLDMITVYEQDAMREKDGITHEAPSIDPNQKDDAEMEENPNNFDYAYDGTYSDIKTNGVKRKADVLSKDSPGEGRQTVSLANVSFAERPSFKIGASIARAASQMAGSPSVLKGSNFGDETLFVESFVSQLYCAATDPVDENGLSDIAIGFFLDFRNSLASQHVALENVNSKRVETSNFDAGGTETFEFQEMDDTYWTDRMIHNGGEEKTPPIENGNYQIVQVELKPAQVQRTRRPYRRRQSQINVPLPESKPAIFDENAPAELIMKFSESDMIPPETSLSKMFRRFGPIRESQTEVDSENNRARVVFKKGGDAKVAYNSAGRFNIFGTKTVNYELSHTITETFKVEPYVLCLGEEDAALYLPSSV